MAEIFSVLYEKGEKPVLLLET